MCGIAGSVNVSQSSFIEDSLNSIHHRGPDSSGFIKGWKIFRNEATIYS